MKLYLLEKGLFDYADGTIEEPEAENAVARTKWLKEDRKALAAICLAVEPNQKIHVMNAKTSKDAWDALQEQFIKVSLSQKCRLRKKFHSLNLERGGDVVQHINNLKVLHEELRQMGENISDKDLAMTLIGSLPHDEFQSLFVSLDVMGEDNLSFEMVKNLLICGAERKAENDESIVFDAKAANVKPVKFQGRCNNCKKIGHMGKNCFQPKKETKGNTIECFKCGKVGHMAKKCRSEDKSNANVAVIREKEVALSCQASGVGLVSDDRWITDSGASHHMTAKRESLENFQKFSTARIVRLGDKGTIIQAL